MCSQTHHPPAPWEEKSGGQNIKQNLILLETGLLSKTREEIWEVFGSDPSSAPGLTGSARLDWKSVLCAPTVSDVSQLAGLYLSLQLFE